MVEGNGNQAVLPDNLHPLYKRSSENLNVVQRECLEQFLIKVTKGAKIRNRYNQVPHLTQDTNGKVTNSDIFFLCPPEILIIQHYYRIILMYTMPNLLKRMHTEFPLLSDKLLKKKFRKWLRMA